MKKLNRYEMKKVWNLIVLVSSIVMILLTVLIILNGLEMVSFEIHNDAVAYVLVSMMTITSADGVMRHWNKQQL